MLFHHLLRQLAEQGQKNACLFICRTESTNKKSRHSNFTHTALTNNVYILSEDQQVN
jgi:hypothetical protein